MIIIPSASFTRPADVTPYSAGDLVANNVAAGSVTPLTWSLQGLRGITGIAISQVRIKKSTVTATLATFLLHLLAGPDAVTAGDNSPFNIANANNYLGNTPLDMATGAISRFTTGELFKQFPLLLGTAYADQSVGTSTGVVNNVLYGYLEATAAYVPASAEVFTIGLGIEV